MSIIIVVCLHTKDTPKAGISPHELLKHAVRTPQNRNPAVLKQIYRQTQQRSGIKVCNLWAWSGPGERRAAKSTKFNQQNELLLLSPAASLWPLLGENLFSSGSPASWSFARLWVAALLKEADLRSAQQMYFSDGVPAPSDAPLTRLLRLPFRRQEAGKERRRTPPAK